MCTVCILYTAAKQHAIPHIALVFFRQLTYIKECCDGEPEGDGVSALTTEERTRWAKVRATPPTGAAQPITVQYANEPQLTLYKGCEKI